MKKTFQLIRSDLARLEKPSFKSFLKWYFHSQGSTFPYQVWLRIIHASQENSFLRYSFGLLFYLIFRHLSFKYGIFVSSHLEIGPGLLIKHGSGVFLNCKSIGSNFTVYQNVTIGVDTEEKMPTVCDNVKVYTGSIVYGDITLHDGCVIGANSVINKTVEKDSFVAGSPGRFIKKVR